MLPTRFCTRIALLLVSCGPVAAAWSEEMTQQQLAKVGVADRFFRAVGTGKVDRLLGICHPGLREKVDAPVLEAWMQHINERMGGYRKLSWSKFERGIQWVNGIKVEKVGGKYLFENGELEAEFEYAGDQLTRFNINSKLLDDDWHQRPTDETIYIDQAKRFLVALMNNDLQTAFNLMHPNLQKIVPLEKLRGMHASLQTEIARLESIEHVRSSHTDKDLYRLTLYFLLKSVHPTSENLTEQIAEVSFDFADLRGNLVSFDLRADAEFPGQGEPDAIAKFLQAVGSGDTTEATQVLHPSLRLAVDPPLFEAWLLEAAAVLGKFSKLDEEHLAAQTVYEDGREMVRIDGKAVFSNGTAEVTSKSFGGKLVAFKVNTDLLDENWFQGIEDTTFYEKRTEDFLNQWLKNEPAKAYEMLHESLRQKLSLAEFENGATQLKRELGKLTSVKIGNPVESNLEGVTVAATVIFDSPKTASASVRYLFDGLRGPVIRFRLTPNPE